MKSRTWIIIFTAIIILCAALYFGVSNRFSTSNTVAIYQDGRLIEKIDLSAVTQEREIELSNENSQNIILVSHNNIMMKSADCPDKICVNHGSLKKGGTPIICLPNRIVIQWEDLSGIGYDAKSGG